MKNLITARLVRLHTGGTFDTDMLRGPRMKFARKAILEAVRGVPVAGNDCGINQVYQGLYSLFGVGGSCTAEMNKQLTEAMKNYVTQN